MSILLQLNPFDFFTDTAGDALDAGYIYIGQPNLDPRIYPAQIFYDEAMTIPAAQPLRTSNGYIVRNGSPTYLFINGNYSILVQDNRHRQIYYVPDFLLIGNAAAATLGDLSNTADPLKGDKLIGFKQPFPGAVGSTVHDKLIEIVSPEDFGAAGDYVIGGSGTDDTGAFQAAFDYCGASTSRKLRLGSGTYLITGTVIGFPFMIEGDPGASTVVFKNMPGQVGFDFLASTTIGRVLGSVGVEYVAEGANLLCGIRGPKDSSQYFSYYLRYKIHDNYCRGANRVPAKYSFAWDFSAEKWFSIGDCTGAEVHHNNIQGAFDIKVDPATQTQDYGIHFDAAGAVLSARVNDNNIGPIARGISIGDNVFITAHDNDLIGTLDGIVWAGASLLNEPKIYNNNINAQRYGVIVDGPDSLQFFGNTIRRHRDGFKGGSSDWYGYRLANVSDLKLCANTVQPDESNGAFPGVLYGYNLLNCSLFNISDNFVGVGCDQGITLTNCTGGTVLGTVSAQNGAGDILFRITANTRRTTIGGYELVSSFSGTVLSKDGTIVDAIQMLNKDFDLQGTGPVNMDMTRVNAAADGKTWRTTVGTTSRNRQVLTDAGSGTNYEIVTRTGAVVDEIQWRATQLRIGNGGPIIRAGSGSPEGVITAPPGSLWLNTTSGGGNYQKLTGTGNTGWVTI